MRRALKLAIGISSFVVVFSVLFFPGKIPHEVQQRALNFWSIFCWARENNYNQISSSNDNNYYIRNNNRRRLRHIARRILHFWAKSWKNTRRGLLIQKFLIYWCYMLHLTCSWNYIKKIYFLMDFKDCLSWEKNSVTWWQLCEKKSKLIGVNLFVLIEFSIFALSVSSSDKNDCQVVKVENFFSYFYVFLSLFFDIIFT